jgi:hypothetical protein
VGLCVAVCIYVCASVEAECVLMACMYDYVRREINSRLTEDDFVSPTEFECSIVTFISLEQPTVCHVNLRFL